MVKETLLPAQVKYYFLRECVDVGAGQFCTCTPVNICFFANSVCICVFLGSFFIFMTASLAATEVIGERANKMVYVCRVVVFAVFVIVDVVNSAVALPSLEIC